MRLLCARSADRTAGRHSGGPSTASARPACRPSSPSSPRAASPGGRRKNRRRPLGKRPALRCAHAPACPDRLALLARSRSPRSARPCPTARSSSLTAPTPASGSISRPLPGRRAARPLHPWRRLVAWRHGHGRPYGGAFPRRSAMPSPRSITGWCRMPIPQQQAEDVAAAIARLIDDARRLGIDRERVIDHRPQRRRPSRRSGRHRPLLSRRPPSADLARSRGVVLLDGAGYDVAAQMRACRARCSAPCIAAPSATILPSRPGSRRSVQAAAPNAGRFLIFHIASRADSGAQSVRLGAPAARRRHARRSGLGRQQPCRNLPPLRPARAIAPPTLTDAFAEALFRR